VKKGCAEDYKEVRKEGLHYKLSIINGKFDQKRQLNLLRYLQDTEKRLEYFVLRIKVSFFVLILTNLL